MEKLGVWQLLKYGFWFGTGFLVPLLLFTVGSTYLSFLIMPKMVDYSMEYESDFSEQEMDGETSFSSFSFQDRDISDQIAIQTHRAREDDDRIVILGSIINNSDKAANMIQLEAEFTDASGEFVYECMDFIAQTLEPSQTENFQINCGCGDNPVPEYSEFTVRVTSASRL